MALVFQNIKLGLEQNGEVQYLDNIQIRKEGTAEKISYQLSADGQRLTNDGATVALRILKANEPDKDFLVFNADM